MRQEPSLVFIGGEGINKAGEGNFVSFSVGRELSFFFFNKARCFVTSFWESSGGVVGSGAAGG